MWQPKLKSHNLPTRTIKCPFIKTFYETIHPQFMVHRVVIYDGISPLESGVILHMSLSLSNEEVYPVATYHLISSNLTACVRGQ